VGGEGKGKGRRGRKVGGARMGREGGEEGGWDVKKGGGGGGG